MPADEYGYVGVGPETGKVIPESEAFEYALDRCLHGTEDEVMEFRNMLIGWYYSGNYFKDRIGGSYGECG